MVDKKDKETKKSYEPITEFTYEAVDTRYKETVIKTLLETKQALDDKVRECDEKAARTKQDNAE